jgi:feruloyl esterase
MSIGFLVAVSMAGLLAPPPFNPPSSSASDQGIQCEELISVAWSGFEVSLAEERDAADGVPAHCVVRGTIDAEIRFELILPVPDAWNGRFVMGGGGGFVGTVMNQASWLAPDFLSRGFASVGTDTGHQGSSIDASWAMDRRDREINFGHRAVHLTAETAKTVIRLHFGRDIDYSYFMGCSRGGGQAMMESQRFPDDFDGIVAGAPAYDWTRLAAQMVQTQQAMYPNSDDLTTPVVTPEIRQLLSRAILERCDSLDGLEDGILNDPRDCSFQPGDLPRCESGDTSESCVTEQQVLALEAVYGGAFAAGKKVFPGFPFGGEVDEGGWEAWVTGGPNSNVPGTPNLHFAFGTQIFKYLVFDDPEWDYTSYDFSTWAADTRKAAEILNATTTDLTPFEVAGGKLILWNGWSDAAITALGTIQYYDALRREHPGEQSFVKLFLLPGVGHCAGGPGPDQVDWLSAIQTWVEEGEAPERLIAAKLGEGGEVQIERPICAYPARALFTGEGDGKSQSGFQCVIPSGGH